MSAPSSSPIELPGSARVLFTTRDAGNLSPRVGAGASAAYEAREALRRELGLDELRGTRQVHGTTVVIVGATVGGAPGDADGAGAGARREEAEADGQATALGGIGLLALTADCLPVAIASDSGVAMLHAGWRGLAAGVLERGVEAVRSLGEQREIAAVIGPGAGPCCYEVGPEVHAALGAPAGQSGPIDLNALAAGRLRAAGVEVVGCSGRCTICDTGLYSHRREGDRAGRLGGIAWRERR